MNRNGPGHDEVVTMMKRVAILALALLPVGAAQRQQFGVAGARADKGNRSSDSSRRTRSRSRLGEQRGKIAISRGASRRQRPPTE